MKTWRILPVALLLLSHPVVAEPQDAIVSRIKREPVKSSNVASIGYSRPLHALEIEFSRGAIYRFLDVQPRVYRELMASSSKGHFIAEKIRGNYRFIRVRLPRSPTSWDHRTHN
jgi:hypothetical protein